MDYKAEDSGGGGFLRSRSGLVLLGFLAIAAFLLLSEHWAHLLGFWPWLLLLACPLLHVFMHGGHGHAPSSTADSTEPEPHRH